VISFRYHLVSIVSVFLALALGVLVGTTVVNQGLIQDLERRTDDAVRSAGDLRRQLTELREELTGNEEFARAAESLLVEGHLAGRQVVLGTMEGVDASDLDGVRRVLEEAGATVIAEMVVTRRMTLDDPASRSDLAAVVGMPGSTDPDVLASTAAQRLGSRLASGPEVIGTDLLEELTRGRFVDIQGGAAFEEIGGGEQAVVLMAGGPGEPLVAPEVLATVVEALAQAFHPVVAAEPLVSEYPFVQMVRDNGGIGSRVVTVDNADEVPGHVALVLGLEDLLLSPGRGGDYGVKDGATGLLPQP
jgi:hypothetical protein